MCEFFKLSLLLVAFLSIPVPLSCENYESDSTYFIAANQTTINQQNVPNLHLDLYDDECEENRFEALRGGRQCLKRCKKGGACENSRKQCLCDGLCGWSCIKPDSSCLELPLVANGRYSHQSSKFKSRVNYECDEGFYLFGSKERVCQGDEEWSGTPVECLANRKYNYIMHTREPAEF